MEIEKALKRVKSLEAGRAVTSRPRISNGHGEHPSENAMLMLADEGAKSAASYGDCDGAQAAAANALDRSERQMRRGWRLGELCDEE